MNKEVEGGCPFAHGGNTSMENPVTKWWPNALNLDILHQALYKVRGRHQRVVTAVATRTSFFVVLFRHFWTQTYPINLTSRARLAQFSSERTAT